MRGGSLALLVLLVCVGAATSETHLPGSGKIAPQLGDPIAVWHPVFSIDFNETSKIIWERTTKGKWWYDAFNENEVIWREDGRGDKYCGSIHALDPTPCKQVVTQGVRYLMFPELNECCRCCTTDKGCGIRPYSWLEHASYIDREVKNGRPTIKWVNKGLKPTYYWSTDDDMRIPVELDEGGFPYDNQAFDVDSFSTASWVSDAELFAVPEDCVQRKCPLKSLCSLP